jgi:hypothetical protein
MFEAKKHVILYAVSIHGPKDEKPRDFTVGYKYVFKDGPDGK